MQPLLNIINNFDAKLGYVFEYSYLGAERVLSNQLSIRKNVKGSAPVYEGETTKFDKNHVLSGGVLNNGVEYAAKIRVKINNVWSEWSPEIKFICLATPKYTFENIQDTKYVYNDDVLMRIIFQQEQGDKVKHFQFVLMDENRTVLVRYDQRAPSSGSPNVLQERVSGLEKGMLYYIGCYTSTYSGIEYFDSKEFVAHFAAPSVSGVVEAVSKNEQGQVLVQAYLKQLLGIQTRPYIESAQNDSSSNYVYADGEWVIIPPDKPLLYQRLGMAKASDFVVKLWHKNILDGKFLEFYTSHTNGVGLTFYKERDRIVCEKRYLDETKDGIVSRHRSNIIDGLGLKPFYMYIKVVEFRVDIKIELI